VNVSNTCQLFWRRWKYLENFRSKNINISGKKFSRKFDITADYVALKVILLINFKKSGFKLLKKGISGRTTSHQTISYKKFS